MNKLEVKNNYIDVTNEWLEKAKPNSHIVKEQLYFDYKGKRYYVDNKNVVLDYSKKELEIAIWLEKTFGGEIFMLPKINKPEGIKTPDYLWNNERWDLKVVTSNGKNVIDNRLNGIKNQSTNIIFDISYNLLSNDKIDDQIVKVYRSPARSWVNKIILIRNYKLIKVYKRKKVDPQPNGQGPTS